MADASPTPPASCQMPTPATAPASLTGTPPARWHSHQLLGTSREVEIAHGDALYRLRLTAQGKLILTK